MNYNLFPAAFAAIALCHGGVLAQDAQPASATAQTGEPAEGAAASAPDPAPVYRLAAGTPISLMVLTEVDSNRQKPGDTFRLRVHEPVADAGGHLVMPVGTLAQGKVDSQDGAGLALQRGELSVSVTQVMLGGRAIPLSAQVNRKGKGGKNDDALKLILVPFYAPFAPGNSAKLKAGELVTANLLQDLCYELAGTGTRVFDCPN